MCVRARRVLSPDAFSWSCSLGHVTVAGGGGDVTLDLALPGAPQSPPRRRRLRPAAPAPPRSTGAPHSLGPLDEPRPARCGLEGG